MRRVVGWALAGVLTFAAAGGAAAAPQPFPLDRVRLLDGPFLDAQETDRRYLLALDTERLLAPFRREAGLPQPAPPYGNWESSGLDGHMGGHYLSALALMAASTGDAELRARLAYVVAELKRCQDAIGTGYLGGIPEGAKAWAEVGAGQLRVDSFSVNGRWVPWYNLHKLFAGLRDAWLHTGNAEAKAMLLRLADWALRLTTPLSDAQMQDMLRSEHGGMNEVLADVAAITGDARYLALARRFSHQALLQPLAAGEDRLDGLHANTQIPKVIGFARIAGLAGEPQGQRAAEFFWRTVVERRSVAIGGNSVKEHFHAAGDFQPMLDEVEGPETCNTANMLRLSALLAQSSDDAAQGRYADFYERALYNHILASQHPGPQGGFAYFTPMRAQHYRVYSKVDEGMWCCVGTGLESHARHGEFIYAHEGDALHVRLFIASTLDWRERGLRITQATRFPDEPRTRITVHGAGRFALKIRHPGWVAAGALKLKLNGRPLALRSQPGGLATLDRHWAAGDQVVVELPMRTTLEHLPGQPDQVAVLHGPIVLAAKTPQPGEHLSFFADGARMGHIAQGPVCPQEAAPVFVAPAGADVARRIRPVPGQPLTFTAPGLIQGPGGAGQLELIPFFRLHDTRYMLYWARSTPQRQGLLRTALARAEAERRAEDAQTIDQVAPGEQQPESDHGYQGEAAESGLAPAGRWRHARGWFSYTLADPAAQARVLRLRLSPLDAGRRFTVQVNGQPLAELTLSRPEGLADAATYVHDIALPEPLVRAAAGRLTVTFTAAPGSIAGGLYGLRLIR